MRVVAVSFALLSAFLCAPALARVRIVTLNASNSASATSGPRTGMETILSAIGSTVSDDPLIAGNSGIATPVDILCLQEANGAATTGQRYATLLNQIYSTTTYQFGPLNGASTGSGTQAVVYNSAAVSLLSSSTVGTASTTGQPRQTLRYQFRPVGLISSTADVYIYNGHWKAGSSDQARRLVEANAIRADADAMPTAANIIVLGDLNTYRSTEDGYQRLMQPGNGRVIDPIASPGAWSGAAGFRAIDTQSPYNPLVNPDFNGTTGGMDDRFDFQLISPAIQTGGSGLEYAVNSYNAFGNDGSHDFNGSIDTGTGAAPNVLTALAGILDHLPVVADYNLRPRLGLAHPGDATLNLTTDIADFAIVAGNFNATGRIWQSGDFTGDGVTDISDFSILAANFNTSATSSRSVPEPAILFGLTLSMLAWRRS